VRQVNGAIENKDALIKALTDAKFQSVRGSFKYGKNHFPIQDFFATEIVKTSDGNLIEANRGLLLKDDVDAYAKDCTMQ
jgi:branched-chain amino acid transport system substrate-binding protein